MLGIPIGILTTNVAEWLFHKYVLHGLGKKKGSIWSNHWSTHHKFARKNLMIDKDYSEPFYVFLNTSEFKAIVVGALSISPLIINFPYFVTTVWLCGAAYFIIHRRSHLDQEWAKKYLPWHFEHHIFGNQEHSWNVTLPITDYIMGTRYADYEKKTTTASNKT